jgi:hypothetical protein
VKILWVIVVILGVIYLGVWAAGKDKGTSSPAASPVTHAGSGGSSGDQLAGIAKGDAISRVPNTASLEVDSIKPGVFSGPDLQTAHSLGGGTTAGFEIVLVATVGDKPVSKLTYHAAPPDRIVFVKQEAMK